MEDDKNQAAPDPQAGKPKTGSKTYTVSSSSSNSVRPKKSLTVTFPSFNNPIPSAKTKARGFMKSYPVVVAVIIVVVLGGLSGFGGAWLENHGNEVVLNGSLSGQKQIVTNKSQLITQIAKDVGPSVVSVNVSVSSSGSSSQGGFGLFGFSQPEQMQQAGTGIIIDSAGLIITNRHVVPAGTTSVSVTLSDGTELKNVSVVGRTSPNDSLDIAFLKINNAEGHKLTPAVIGNSSQVQVGDDVVAIGNALGQFQNTVTSGIISGYGRSVQASSSTGTSSENLNDLFQTDAAINEGNSGGPLVNLNGQVIGINTAIAGNAQNIGFAIPINDVKGLIDQVIKTGHFSRPYLGIRYIPLTADVASEYGLSVQNGAFIAPSSDPTNPSIVSGSPADKAGLQVNDIITQVNGVNIDQMHSLTSLLSSHMPGDNINLTVVRGGKTIHVSVTLGSMPSTTG